MCVDLLSEVTVKVQSAFDGGQLLETIDLLQHGIVGNLVRAIDRLQLRNGDVGQGGVIDEDETASGGQVGCHECLHGVAIKSKVLTNVG